MERVITPRLHLLALAPEHWRTLRAGVEEFSRCFGHAAAAGLREFMISPEISQEFLAKLETDTGPDVWSFGAAMVHLASDSVIGTVGFKGSPDAAGMVEIAYGVVPAFQGQGYATEATRAMTQWAFSQDAVRIVRAHTLPAWNASTRVLTKCGFRRLGEVIEPDDGLVWRWEIERTA